MTQLQSRGTELIKALRASRRRRRGMATRRTSRFAAESLEVRVAPAVWSGLGGDALWSNEENWEDSALPQANDDLTFPDGAGNLENTNDLDISNFKSITIGGSGYTLSGNAISLTEGITANYSGLSFIDLDLELNDAATAMNIGPESSLYLWGALSGEGAGLSLTGGGVLDLFGANTYDGLTTVSGYSALFLAEALGGPVELNDSYLWGHGTIVGGITSLGTDVIRPNVSPIGVLTSNGDVLFNANTTFDAWISDNFGGMAHSELTVNGLVTLGGATLSLNIADATEPGIGDTFTIINNTGDAPINGTFNGLDEGAILNADGQSYRISYVGGDGNDVVLTALGQTTVTVSSSANPSEIGEPVTFSAIVSATGPGVATPSGQATLVIDGSEVETVALDEFGAVEFSPIATLAHGNHTVTVNYLGDDDFEASSGDLADLQVVGESVETTTVVSVTSNPSVFGEPVTFSAIISTDAPDVAPPMGLAVLIIDDAEYSAANVDEFGIATFDPINDLAVGTHSVSVSFRGEGIYESSWGDLADDLVVNQATTTTTIASSDNPSDFGQSITFTVTVSAAPPSEAAPTGQVTLTINDEELTADLDEDGVATFGPISDLAIGTYTVTATYAGSDNFAGSDATLDPDQEVVQARTTTTVASDANPSEFGDAVTFTATVSPTYGEGTPTGDATLIIDGEILETVALDENGVATFAPISDLTIGNHTVTVSYLGDDTYLLSDGTLTDGQEVVRASTAATVVSSANPADLGSEIVFTATVAPNNPDLGTPTGDVELYIDGILRQTLPVGEDGNVVFDAIDDLEAGSHNVTVSYAGDDVFAPSGNEDSPLVQTVVIATTTTVTASPTSSNVGEEVTFTATVSSDLLGSPPLTGTVVFLSDGNPIEGGTVELGDDGTAVFTTSALPAGSHEIKAIYQGSDTYKASTGELETNPFVVSSTTSTLELATNIPTSGYGQPVTFTATVSVPREIPATGTVTFVNGETGEVYGTVPVENGKAAITVSNLPIGLRWITAGYSGDQNYTGSTNAVVQETIQGLTTLELTTSDASEIYGEPVTFTATVSPVYTGSSTPTGSVTFVNGESGEHLATVEIVEGQATFTASGLPVGLRWITAGYSGDQNYTGSTAAVAQETTQGTTTLELSSSSSTSEFGQSVTFTATVSPAFEGAADPSGIVTFVNGETGEVLGTGHVENGQATFTTSNLPVGVRWITAGYSGDQNYTGSTNAVSQQTDPASTTTTLTSSVNPAVFGQSVTYTADVAVSNEGASDPRGGIAFYDGTDLIGIAPVVDGKAAITLPATGAGRSHAITAQYVAESSWQGSTSSLLEQRVEAAQTETTLTATSSVVGQRRAVILTARVTPVSPGAGAPTGRVAFVVNGQPFREAAVIDGVASIQVPFQRVARRGIAAVYEGSGNFHASRSPVLVIGGNVLQGGARPFSLV